MNITTRYNIEQRVWIMHDDEPQEWIVKAIHIGDITQSSQPMPTYDLYTTQQQPLRGVYELKNVFEYKIFTTKRGLCLSFLTDNE